MKAERKRQKQTEKTQAAKKRRVTTIILIVVAIGALAFAARSYAPASSSESGAATTEGFRRISVDELKPLFDRGDVTIIDVRPADAYAQSHIPGALQIPLARIDGEAQYLPKDKLIVAYCTCPAEESSGQAAQILGYRGVTNVAALTGGLEAWQRRSYPVGTGMPAR